MSTLCNMVAEVIFHNPNDVAPATATLIELDCAVEVLDLIDDFSPAVWVLVRTVSRLSDFAFFDWIHGILEPLGGYLLEAGLERDAASERVEMEAKMSERKPRKHQ
jgi:hypothetical protein